MVNVMFRLLYFQETNPGSHNWSGSGGEARISTCDRNGRIEYRPSSPSELIRLCYSKRKMFPSSGRVVFKRTDTSGWEES
jgi:hypothetical protein